jgi:hypothetical protein
MVEGVEEAGLEASSLPILLKDLGGIWADRFGGKVVLGFGVVWWSFSRVHANRFLPQLYTQLPNAMDT